MEVRELSKSGILFSELKLSSRAKSHVEVRSLQPTSKQNRNDLRIIKNMFQALLKRFERKNMLKLSTKNCRLKSITQRFRA